MPKITKNFNPNFSSPGSDNTIVKLDKLGDSITIRLVDYPVYFGQHWLLVDNKKKPINCDRVNSPDLTNPQYCKICEDYAKGDKTSEEVKKLKPTVRFVFAAVDMKTHEAIFFETSPMVWTEMSNQENKGIKILDYDWLIERTENLPKYYDITRLEKDPLVGTDKEAYDEAKKLDLNALVNYKMGTKKDLFIDEDLINPISETEEELVEDAPDEMPS